MRTAAIATNGICFVGRIAYRYTHAPHTNEGCRMHKSCATTRLYHYNRRDRIRISGYNRSGMISVLQSMLVMVYCKSRNRTSSRSRTIICINSLVTPIGPAWVSYQLVVSLRGKWSMNRSTGYCQKNSNPPQKHMHKDMRSDPQNKA